MKSKSWLGRGKVWCIRGDYVCEFYGKCNNNCVFKKSRNIEKVKPCKICSIIKKSNVTHHIDGNRKNNIERNLITLCISCHKKLHLNKKLGFFGNN